MKTVTLGISTIAEGQQRMAAAFEGKRQGAFISFTSIDLLWRTLTPQRWELLSAMTGQGGVTIPEIARRLDRDVDGVRGDVETL